MPVNITITTPTTTTAARAAQAARTAAKAASIPVQMPSLGTLGMVVLGIFVVLGIVLFLFFIVTRRGKHTGIIEAILANPDADAIGLLLDTDSGTATFVPLRRVENFYMSEDLRNPAIVVSNPHTSPFSIKGKPLITAVTAGKLGGLQTDLPSLTALGLARITVEGDEWQDTSDPQKSFTKLLQKLITMSGEKKGTILLAPDTKLAVYVSPPKVVLMMIRQHIELINAVISYMVGLVAALERVADKIREYRLRELAVKRQTIATIVMAVGMLALIIGLVLYLLRLKGGG